MSDKKNVPKIRFPGFTEPWEQRKLGEIATYRNGKAHEANQLDVGTYELVNLNSISIDGGLKPSGKFIEDGSDTLQRNDLVMVLSDVGHGDLLGRVAIIPENNRYVLNQRVALLRINDDTNTYFLFSIINRYQDYFKKLGAGSSQLNISRGIVENFEVAYPNVAEQRMIADYFQSLDHLITLHQRKLEHVKKMKKSMLQKMFPKKNQLYPEVRFPGFTDAWEQRKFGEITELKSASRVHKDEWTSNGVPFYRSSDVMAAINGTENEKAFISEELYEKLSKVSGKLEEGDILVTGGGSVGNPYIVTNNKPLYTKDADLLWIKNKGKFHPYFLYEFFFSPTFRNYLGSISHVGTIAHYTITQLSDTPICLPSFDEQKEVGEYFQSLDHLITLHQRELDHLQLLKKGMLQQMFI